ncbi:hypothetical protein [Gordonia hankookensis]|uniref:Uncharacterized protein n=1 Tax=Gordonia hankookensis TaxID=589403 RepID=A0ABR7WJM5_9ACTN|nr:hypothetical protein [Gordonia hankookensis]MBD1322127.1 hypothetical protein [Gordonia hankookensis]
MGEGDAVNDSPGQSGEETFASRYEQDRSEPTNFTQYGEPQFRALRLATILARSHPMLTVIEIGEPSSTVP